MKYNRRDFLKISYSASMGLVIGIALPIKNRLMSENIIKDTFDPNVWVSIQQDNIINIITAKSEMGQHIRSSIPMIVAEELNADWSKVKVVQADTHPNKYGSQSTGGSGSIRRSYMRLRKAGATAKELLIQAASIKWDVPQNELKAEMNQIFHAKSKKSIKYGDLILIAGKLDPPSDPKLKDEKDFTIIGNSLPGLDTKSRVDGTAKFGIDIRIPNMLYATVAKCQTFGGAVKSFKAKKAKKINGVKYVFEVEGGIAVVATNTWSAIKGQSALDIEWEHGDFYSWNSEKIKKMMEDKSPKNAVIAKDSGDTKKIKNDLSVESQYEVSFTSHATMEPMNCVAQVNKNSVELWVPTQSPQRIQSSIAEKLNLKIEKVKVNVTLMGGGFGRRLFSDFIPDAVEISKKIKKPVKLLWTREDDMRHDYYRPASIHKLKGSISDVKKIESWQHRIISPSISGQRSPERFKNGELDRSAVNGANNLPYDIPNILVDYIMTNTKVPVGWWRSVYNSQNAFANEVFIDELAYKAGIDSLEFRMKMLNNSPRHKEVLKLAAEKANWGRSLTKGQGMGIAVHESFGSWSAQVATVSISKDRNISVDKIVASVDCGTVINPDGVKAQMEGSIVYGLTSTLKGEITIDKGAVSQSNFHDFELLQMNEMPKVEIYIVPSLEPPGGAGEPGLPPVAPAVANAIFNATGKRVRKLPIKAEDLKV
ncbi:MAG: xanthine dehydrogenase family protein molybdopterin-binding subunit [Candidatus Marinimicrobia bacterium]|nr:xanthine dehydrogenase family protein molybdopterin-binding subunit [Candidatus Neomarinimicrobiota bacterium]